MSLLVRRAAARVVRLTDRDRSELLDLVDADPLVNAVAAARLHGLSTLEARRLGGDLLGVRGLAGELRAAAFVGGNLLPIAGDVDDWRALGEVLAGRRPAATSLVGRRCAVRAIWQVVEPAWGRPRAIRDRQLLLALDRADQLPAGDPRLRAIRPGELQVYLPAAAAMFTEELGVAPDRGGASGFRARVAGLINARRALGIVENGSVIFKADLGVVSPHTCQLQGVWVRPDLRGRGIGTAALAGVLRHALALAPSVSLYVNDFNLAARRVYARLGMREVATLSTVLR
jgi:predicted GNAT family acetyltransferase